MFPNTIPSSTAIENPSSGDISSCSGILPGRGSTSRAIFIDVVASHDDAGVVYLSHDVILIVIMSVVNLIELYDVA